METIRRRCVRCKRFAIENCDTAQSANGPVNSCTLLKKSFRRRCDFQSRAESSAFQVLAARGETPAAFGRRCIPPPPQRGCRVGGPGSGCVAPRSNTPGIAPHRAQHARWGPRSALVAPFRRGPHGADCAPWGGGGRIAALGATLDFHHGLL